MAPTKRSNLVKSTADKSKLPRPSMGAPGTRRPSMLPVLASKQKLIATATARLALLTGQESIKKIDVQVKKAVLPAPRNSTIVTASGQVIGFDSKSTNQPRRLSTVIPPPRKSIIAPITSRHLDTQMTRKSMIFKPPSGNRLSFYKEKNASGTQFGHDQSRPKNDSALDEDNDFGRPAPQLSIYTNRRNRQSIGGTGLLETARTFGRQIQAVMEERATTGPGLFEETAAKKTPGRVSIYRQNFATSTPLSAQKDDTRNVFSSVDIKTIPKMMPLAEPMPRTPAHRKPPMVQVTPPTPPPKKETGALSLRDEIDRVTSANEKETGRLGMKVYKFSPAKPTLRGGRVFGKSPSTTSRYNRRTTMEFEEIFSNFSPGRLENELETVNKQKKALEKLLSANNRDEETNNRPPESVINGLPTIAESSGERESVSARPGSSASAASTSANNGIAEEDEPSTSGSCSSQSNEQIDNNTEDAVRAAKIRNRRRKVDGDMDDGMRGAFGMRLRSRNPKYAD